MSISASIVTYKTDYKTVKRLIERLLSIDLEIKLFVIDNSPDDELKKFLANHDMEYISVNNNIGYGRAHNIGIKRSINDSKYHLILNPDVYFEDKTIEGMFHFMEKNPDVGLAMPKVLYPDGSIQYLCKLLPGPFDLITRRFFPKNGFIERINKRYELRFADYDDVIEAPYLSGCFMFVRKDALHKAGLFDERFFMYFEDTDLSRRIHRHYRTVYYPHVTIYHDYEKGSYKDRRLLWAHLKSAIRYFNKWGWFFDKERRKINKNAIHKLNEKGYL